MDLTERLDGLGGALAAEQDQWPRPSHAAERNVWLARAEGRSQHLLGGRFLGGRRNSWKLGAWALTATASVAACVLLIGWLQTRPDGRLEVELGGVPASDAVGRWIAAPAKGTLPLEFSDGSQIELGAESRARLLELRKNGAHMALESGQASVHIVPGPSADWQWRAGPFVVKVVGTRFDLSWDAENDLLKIELHSGRIDLSGCVFGNGRTMSPGETLRAWCKKNHYEIEAKGEAQAADQESRTAPKRAHEPPKVKVGKPVGLEPKPSVSWRDLAGKGDYSAAFEKAKAAGLGRILATAEAGELIQLADVARFAGELNAAMRAYRRVRSRYPGSGQAATAAYSLARIEFDQRGSYGSAARWFRAYLAEQPEGPLAREALGRLMESLDRSGKRVSAQQAARRYLSSYGSGPHAELARSLLNL